MQMCHSSFAITTLTWGQLNLPRCECASPATPDSDVASGKYNRHRGFLAEPVQCVGLALQKL